jgi:hypothetical protein
VEYESTVKAKPGFEIAEALADCVAAIMYLFSDRPTNTKPLGRSPINLRNTGSSLAWIGTSRIVEADETYVGGKPRKGTDGRKTTADRKTPVAVLVVKI